MSTQRALTDDERAELADLTAAVTAAIEARRTWLDAKMRETSRLHVGDDIYDVRAGMRLGTVSELYRFSRDRDEGIRDTDAHCDYRYETHPNSFGNTSCQAGKTFGTREDAILYAERRASALRGETA